MSAVYWRVDPASKFIRDNKHAQLIWIQARTVGVNFDYRDGVWITFGLTADARPKDERRYEAKTCLSGLFRAIREHEKLADDPVLKWTMFYLALDYVVELLDRKR